MLEKLAEIEDRFKEVEQGLMDPEAVLDQKKYRILNKEFKELKKIVDAYHAYRRVLDNLAQAKSIIADESDDEVERRVAELQRNVNLSRNIQGDTTTTIITMNVIIPLFLRIGF